MDEIDNLQQEDRSFPPADAWRRDANARDPGVYARAAADPEAFWAAFASELEWITPWSRVLEWKPPNAKWFVGGTLNASANCLDRHIGTEPAGHPADGFERVLPAVVDDHVGTEQLGGIEP